MKTLISAALLVLGAAGCHEQRSTTAGAPDASATAPAEKPSTASAPGPRVLVYRTRTPMNDHVPITLTPDRSDIRSYPDPADLRGLPAPLPTELHQGYLLDNRGISLNTVFLDMTYSAYAALPQAPAREELLAHIADKEPLVELCDCGPRTGITDVVQLVNGWIDDGSLRQRCTVVK